MSIKTFSELALELLNNNQNILLLADGGYGKTVALVELYRKILNEKIAINKKNLIPIFVPAAMCEFGLRKYIAMHYYGNHISATEKDMEELILNYDKIYNADNSLYQFVVIIDGINEKGNVNDFYVDINMLSHFKNVNVILASRNVKELNDFIKKGFTHVTLSRISQDKAKTVFSLTEKLPAWAYTPFYLSILKKIKISDSSVLNEYQLIDKYVEYSKDKLKNGWNHVCIVGTSFIEELNTTLDCVFPIICSSLLQSNILTFSVTKSLLIVIEKKFGYALNNNQLIDICDSVLVPMGLLIPVSHAKKYKIKHEIFRDYFVAKYLMQLCKDEEMFNDNECFEIVVEILSNNISKDILRYFTQSLDKPYAHIQRINDYISKFDVHRNCAILNRNIVLLFSVLGNEIRDADLSNRNLISCDFCAFDRILNSCFNGSVFGNESLPLKNIPSVNSSIISNVHGKVNINNDICTFVSNNKCFIVDLETGKLKNSFEVDFNIMISTMVFEYKGCSYLTTPGMEKIFIYNLSTLEEKEIFITTENLEMHFINNTIYGWWCNTVGKLFVYNIENNTSQVFENISNFGGDENRCIWYIDNNSDEYCVRFSDDNREYNYPLRETLSQAFYLEIDYSALKTADRDFSVVNNFSLDDNTTFVTNHMICWDSGINGTLSFSDGQEILDATYINRNKGLIAILVGKTNQGKAELLVFDITSHSIDSNLTLDIVPFRKNVYYQHLLATNANSIAVLCEKGVQILKIATKRNKIEKSIFIPSEIDKLANLFSCQNDFILHIGKRIIRIHSSGEIVWEIHNNTQSFFYKGKNFSDDLYFFASKGNTTKVISLDKFQTISVLDTSFPFTENLYFTEDPNVCYFSYYGDSTLLKGMLGTIVFAKNENEYKRLFKLSRSRHQEFFDMDNVLIPNFECLDFHVINESHYIAYGILNNKFDINHCIYSISNDQDVNKLFSLSIHDDLKAVYCSEKYFICRNNIIDIISVSGEHSHIEVKFDLDMPDEIHGISKNNDCFLLFKNSKGWFIAKYDDINQNFLSKFISKNKGWSFVEYSSDDMLVFKKWELGEHTEYTFGISLNDVCAGITSLLPISKINPDNGNIEYVCSNNNKIVYKNIDNGTLCIFDKSNMKNRYDLFPFLTDVTGSSFENANLSQQEKDILKQYGAIIDK